MGGAGPGKEEASPSSASATAWRWTPTLPELCERFGVRPGEPIGGGWVPKG